MPKYGGSCQHLTDVTPRRRRLRSWKINVEVDKRSTESDQSVRAGVGGRRRCPTVACSFPSRTTAHALGWRVLRSALLDCLVGARCALSVCCLRPRVGPSHVLIAGPILRTVTQLLVAALAVLALAMIEPSTLSRPTAADATAMMLLNIVRLGPVLLAIMLCGVLVRPPPLPLDITRAAKRGRGHVP